MTTIEMILHQIGPLKNQRDEKRAALKLLQEEIAELDEEIDELVEIIEEQIPFPELRDLFDGGGNVVWINSTTKDSPVWKIIYKNRFSEEYTSGAVSICVPYHMSLTEINKKLEKHNIVACNPQDVP